MNNGSFGVVHFTIDNKPYMFTLSTKPCKTNNYQYLLQSTDGSITDLTLLCNKLAGPSRDWMGKRYTLRDIGFVGTLLIKDRGICRWSLSDTEIFPELRT
jgi:hypothetical protein